MHRARFPGKTRGTHGFTLIELLLVIAVIAVLSALLLPALKRAREGAKQATCLSNLRQIGFAWQMYLQDFDQFPPNTTILGSVFGGKTGSDAQWGGNLPAHHRVLNPYVHSAVSEQSAMEVFHCPSDDGFNDGAPGSAFDRFGSSYIYNDGGLCELSPKGTRHPAKIIVAGDAGWFIQLIAPDAARFWHTDSERNPRFNMLFLDWHVGFVTISTSSTREENGTGWPDA